MHNIENPNALVCPICGAPLSLSQSALVCGGERKHNFDKAKSGYVNLNTHKSTSGDDKEMAKARQSFLRGGYYKPFADAIAKEVGGGELLVDAGCGEGYYTELCAENFDAALGVDLSKFALDLAAKSAKQKGLADKIFYATASVYELPVKENSVDALVNIFAPCVENEYARVLKNGGRLVVAAAGKDHLAGLKGVLYENVTENEERHDYPKNMRLENTVKVQYIAKINGEDIWQLFMMTPYYYKTSKEAAEKLKSLQSLETLLDFEIRTYIKEEK